MVARSAKAIERSMLRKGFRIDKTKHRRLQHYVGEDPTGIVTFVSHGVDDYGDELLSQMSRQLFLTKAELLKLIDCQMSGEDYATLMRDRGSIR